MHLHRLVVYALSVIVAMHFIGILALISSQSCEETGNNTIQTSTGKLIGLECFIQTGKHTEEFGQSIPLTIFRSIPYGRPAVGKHNRFRPSRRMSWTGVYDARSQPRACIQPTDRRVYSHADRSHYWDVPEDEMSEDCLYLSITAPRNCDNCGVLVWLHGNDFSTGSNTMLAYDGIVLAASQQIIYVSINYRMGAFGFLYGASRSAPGNVGLTDQQLALKWIHENIHAFGGDPDKLTLAGDNSGAACVGYHLNNLYSKRLINRAVMYGGNHFTPEVFRTPARALNQTKELASLCGCQLSTTSSLQSAIDCLSGVDAETLRARSEQVQCNPLFCVPFGPTYDRNMFVRESTIARRSSQLWPPVPVINGVNMNQVISSLLTVETENLDGFGYHFDEHRITTETLENLSRSQFDFLMRQLSKSIHHSALQSIDAGDICLALNSTSMLSTDSISPETLSDIVLALLGAKGLPNQNKNYRGALLTCLSDIFVNCPVQMFLDGLFRNAKETAEGDSALGSSGRPPVAKQESVASLYVMNLRPHGSFWPEWAGANIGDELLYTMGHFARIFQSDEDKYFDLEDNAWSRIIMTALGDFIKGSDIDGSLGFPGHAYNNAVKPYLLLDNNRTHIKYGFRDMECKIWTNMLYITS